MRVAWLEPPSLTVQGDQIYRTVQPARGLSSRPGTYVIAGNWLQPPLHDAAESADLLMLCQAVDIDFLALLQRRRRAGRTTLVELNDNFLEPRAFGEVGSFYHAPSQSSLALQLATLADGLVVSTPYLAALFGPYNQNLLVLPNSVADLGEGALLPERHGAEMGLRVGWAGSAGHQPDVVALMPTLRTLLQRHPALTLCIMAPHALHPLFDWAPRGALDLREATSLEGYLDFISTWDLGLAPLLDTPFNRGRSDVKFLEYARCGVPIIASRGPAYHTVVHGHSGWLVESIDAMADAASTLMANPALRQSLRTHAARYVASERLNPQACALLQHFVQARMAGRTVTPPGRSARWFERLTQQRPEPSTERFHYLQSTAAEATVFNGLQAAQATQDGGCMAAAQTALPAFYLPHLYAGAFGAAGPKALKHLQTAARLAPNSAAVALHLTHAHMANKNGVLAAAAAAAASAGPRFCAQAQPYAPLWEAAAGALEAMGQTAASLAARLEAMRANPLYAPAARALAHDLLNPHGAGAQALGPETVPEVMEALRRNAAGHAPAVADSYLLGRLLASAQAWPEALAAFASADRLASLQAAHGADAADLTMCLPWLAKAALIVGQPALARRCLGRLQHAAARGDASCDALR